MALTTQEDQFCRDLMALNSRAIELLKDAELLLAEYSLNNYANTITDQNLTLADTALRHLTLTKIQGGIAALDTLNNSVGTSWTSGQRSNLVLTQG